LSAVQRRWERPAAPNLLPPQATHAHLALVAATLTAMMLRAPTRSTLPANGIGVLHSDGSVTDGLRTGLAPEAIAYGAGSL
jgi:hypothetical protein